MLVVHATWVSHRLHFWAESLSGFAAPGKSAGEHPFAASADALAAALTALTVPGVDAGPLQRATVNLRLPAISTGSPAPSDRLAHAMGHGTPEDDQDQPKPIGLGSFSAPSITVAPEHAARWLQLVDESALEHELSTPSPAERALLAGDSVAFFATAARLALSLVAQQRFVPALRQEASGELRGLWQPWLGDAAAAERIAALLEAMPPAARAGVDPLTHQAWPILEDFLFRVVDAHCRRTLILEDMRTAIESRDPAADPSVAWLAGVLGAPDEVPATRNARADLIKGVRRWLGVLEERGPSSAWRLCLELQEPPEADLPKDPTAPVDDLVWQVAFKLQSLDSPDVHLDAADIWLLSSDSVTIRGRRVDAPQELLLGELARAARLFKPIESALEDSEPTAVELSTKKAYEFLREVRPILIEQGFGVIAPDWWDSPGVRLGARLKIDSPEPAEVGDSGPGTVGESGTRLGLRALVEYHWSIEIGGATLTLKEFQELAARKTPLVRINGRWVEVRPEDVEAAVKFIRENPGGMMEVGEALRMAYAADSRRAGVPIVSLEATGWVQTLLSTLSGQPGAKIPDLITPESFKGTLRPYQSRGISWLAFLEKFGLGACLADDMGLGKTIQLLALLAHEREHAKGQRLAPTLLVVPTSVVGNWVHETRRFCPHLKVVLHHGPERLAGDAFVNAVNESDMVVTTYALAHRDKEMLHAVQWRRVVLDEAQYIKNPTAKQSQAVRDLNADRRVALTGTPVENRLSELWSIMEFLNPAYLGAAATFRKRFSVPIERYRDGSRAQQLRGLIQPFVLRRLKTDPTVVADLPEKLESREYCHLTPEQASLYESLVKRMLGEIEQAEGIHRRGLVLATLIRLKQACNHPAQLLKDHDFDSPTPPSPSRSGKCVRILEMLDEVLGSGEQALVFTQFRQMGHLLSVMLRHELDREVLFLHGGTTQTQRQAMVEKFQQADGTTPIFVVSLKAGGVGLNLTAATHVFHFDRWWNPAVENQATDRAYRIGQTRTVQVHKFVVRGTLEEKIDEMIESKTELAENIIGSGENWLTELDTTQLRDLLTLRSEAIGVED